MSIDVIVVGIDDSPGSCAAANWTVELALDVGATVVGVHSYEPLAHVEELEPGYDFAAVREEIGRKLSREWCRPLADAGIAYEARVEEGRPADVIVAVANEVGADLVVVGARRMGLVKTVALGSTSTQVIRDAPCPVTVVHPPEE